MPAVMWTEEYQADYLRGHLEVAARKYFAAVRSTMRVDGLNMKGVFTRARQPKLAAYVLREFWV